MTEGDFADLTVTRLEYRLTEDAVDLGLDAALPPLIELGSKNAEFGRGERRTAITDLSVRSSSLPCALVGPDRWRDRSG
jgi:hypothetical protein